MSPERVWSDVYRCPHALWAGLPGGHRWLVVAPPRHVGPVAQTLDALRFKGSVHLLVTEDLTPLEAALREVQPRGVLVVGETLSGGGSVTLPERVVEQDKFAYREGGEFPAWSAALTLGAPSGECAPASLCAAHGIPVVSVAPGDLRRVLGMWFAQTPHSLAHA